MYQLIKSILNVFVLAFFFNKQKKAGLYVFITHE